MKDGEETQASGMKVSIHHYIHLHESTFQVKECHLGTVGKLRVPLKYIVETYHKGYNSIERHDWDILGAVVERRIIYPLDLASLSISQLLCPSYLKLTSCEREQLLTSHQRQFVELARSREDSELPGSLIAHEPWSSPRPISRLCNLGNCYQARYDRNDLDLTR